MSREEREHAILALEELRVQVEAAERHHALMNDAWWNGLTEDEREGAFYAVCKRIYEARIKDDRSYRGTLYDKFGFGPHMYAAGMECGFFSLHNMLHDAVELEAMKDATRFEVIDDQGRKYVNHLNDNQHIKFSLQDDDRTLKVFIDTTSWKEDL